MALVGNRRQRLFLRLTVCQRMPSTKSPKASPGKKGKVKYAKAAKGKAKGERDACPGQNQKTRRASVGPRGQSQSCHQCRQSIHSSKGVSEVKSGQERIKCSTCTRYWCEQCLQNRYGIAPGSLERASWSCPVCSKNCNCSICRKKAGKLATGILTPLVKNAGYECVSEFLTKGTDDIAKCLQWSSPDGTQRGEGRPQKKQKPAGKAKSPPGKRKRKRSTSQQENKELQADTSDEPLKPGAACDPGSCDPASSSDPGGLPNGCQTPGRQEASRSHRDEGGCHGNSPKRRRLNHSQYSITVEEEEPLTAVAKEAATPTVTGQASQTSPARGEGILEDSPPPSMDDLIAFGDALRRSPRRRAKTVKFAAKDFKEKPDNPRGDRKSRRRRSASHDQEGDCEAVQQMHDEFEALKVLQLGAIRSQKMEERRKVMEEKAERRETEKRCKEEVRQERAREREAQGRRRGEKRLQLRLARGIVREAQRERLRRDRERTRVRKQTELQELKQRKAEEKRRKQGLVSVPLLSSSAGPSPAVGDDDSPRACRDAGVPELPLLPGLGLAVPQCLVSQLLFVSEFLWTFAGPLRVKKLRAGHLLTALSSGRGLPIIYQKLLKAAKGSNGSVGQLGAGLEVGLGSGRKLKELEGVAKEYLYQTGRNGFPAASDAVSLEGSLLILEPLCQEALGSPCVVEHLESMRERCEEVRREGRLREREKSKEIGERLRGLCEQGCSVEELEGRRDEVAAELTEIRNETQRERYALGLAVRNPGLGEDRLGRRYWRLQSVPGIVVSPPSAGEADTPGAEDRRGNWYAINSEELLTNVMECLYQGGRREKPLYEALHFHRGDVLATLGRAKKESTVGRFYGSRALQ